MLAIYENHRKITVFVLIPTGSQKIYNPHIIVADRDDNPRLRSPLFYL
jgi:hypothetical protein